MELFNAHNARYSEVNQQRIDTVRLSRALTDDAAIIEPNRILIEVLGTQLKRLLDGIKRLDRDTRRRYLSMDDRHLYVVLPGAGIQLAPRLLVAFETNCDRYKVAAELQKYSGIAPVIEKSGQKSWIH
jgi:hypothetical protein